MTDATPVRFIDNFLTPFGRTNRARFLLCLFVMLGAELVAFAVLLATSTTGDHFTRADQFIVGLAGNVAILMPSIRRLHDLGLNGWWFLAGWIPLLGWLILIAMLIAPGSKRPNAWGDPTPPLSL